MVRNAADTIEDTMFSVHSQNYPNIEYIVIDGASTDGTMEIVNRYSEKLFKVVSEPDSGTYDAMNKGLTIATGDIIGFLNADDVFADHTVLEQVARVFQDKSVEICYADLVYVEKDNINKIVRYWKSAPFKKGAFARGWCPPHPTFYVRRSVYQRWGGFDSSYKLAADAELIVRFMEKGRARSAYIPSLWVKMRVGGQTNLNVKNIIRQNKEILRSLRQHQVPVTILTFVASKLLSRFVQRLSRNNV